MKLPRTTALTHYATKRKQWLLPLWSLVAFLASIAKSKLERHNNFTIFRSSYWHFETAQPLYIRYPADYFDVYLYGPTFAILIAPIAWLPEFVSFFAWQLMLAVMLFWAISKLPVSFNHKLFIGLFSLNEMVTGLMMMQWNIGIGALIILAFAFTEERKEHWAALCIAIGLTTKIYGIVGLAFFPFAKNKWRFALWTILWTSLLLLLPYAFGDAPYVTDQYRSWIEALSLKNGQNHFSLFQNISLLGIIRKWTGLADYSDLIPLGIGLIIYGLPLLRFKQYAALAFRLNILASTLLFTVLFSTGSESSSYIICFPAIAIWWLNLGTKRCSMWNICLIIGAFVLSSLSPTDLFPKAIRNSLVLPYALKALPPSIIWLTLSYELLTRDYKSISNIKCN